MLALFLAAFSLRLLPYLYKLFFPAEMATIQLFYLPELLTIILSFFILALYLVNFKKQADLFRRKIAVTGLLLYFYVLIDTYLIIQAIYLKGYYSLFIWMSMLINLLWIGFITRLSLKTVQNDSLLSIKTEAGEDFIRKYALTSTGTSAARDGMALRRAPRPLP